MKLFVVLGVLALALLLLGCGGQTPPAGPAGGTGAGTGAGAGAAGSGGGTGAGGAGSGAGNAANNLAGLGYLQLVELGVPVECTVKSTTDGVTSTTLMKMKGKNSMMETSYVDPQTKQETKTTAIVKGTANMVYMKVSGSLYGQFAAGCDWLAISSSNETQAPSGAVNTTELEGLPASDFTCQPSLFGDEVFATPGKVCDFSQILAGMMGGSGAGATGSAGGNAQAGSGMPAYGTSGSAAAYCETLQEPDRTDCMNAFAAAGGSQ